MSQILHGRYLHFLENDSYLKSKFSSMSLYFYLLNLATLVCGHIWSAGPEVGMESWVWSRGIQ